MEKKFLLPFVIFGLLFLTGLAQDTANNDTAKAAQDTTKMDTSAADTAAGAPDTLAKAAPPESAPGAPEKPSGHQVIKEYFIEGGPFMFPVLICLIIGLAVCIERIITLNLKTVNSQKLLNNVESHLKNGEIEKAQETTRDTRGPIASIFYQAFDRRSEGIDIVEKSIISYGSVQMGLLEKGLTWISLFIAIAPMLGFMGTVIGMIQAFDAIEAAGDISPSLVAGGIKVALLTTVAGLIVAIILQVFYNYLVAKVDNIVNDMEDSSISLVDMMIKYGVTKKSNE